MADTKSAGSLAKSALFTELPAKVTTPTAIQHVTTANLAEVTALIDKADSGDKKALAELVGTFGSTPRVWRATGDIAEHAAHAWLAMAFNTQLFAKEATRRKMEALRAELSGTSGGNASRLPTPLEKLLIDRIIVNWLAVNYADTVFCQNMATMTIEQSDHAQRRLNRAQRRYLDAILALAKVRRLLLPTVQLNIGERQVNVAS